MIGQNLEFHLRYCYFSYVFLTKPFACAKLNGKLSKGTPEEEENHALLVGMFLISTLFRSRCHHIVLRFFQTII